MLILSRKANEGITIQCGKSQAHIQVLELHEGEVRLGFKAKKDIKIWRDELMEVIHFMPESKAIHQKRSATANKIRRKTKLNIKPKLKDQSNQS